MKLTYSVHKKEQNSQRIRVLIENNDTQHMCLCYVNLAKTAREHLLVIFANPHNTHHLWVISFFFFLHCFLERWLCLFHAWKGFFWGGRKHALFFNFFFLNASQHKAVLSEVTLRMFWSFCILLPSPFEDSCTIYQKALLYKTWL